MERSHPISNDFALKKCTRCVKDVRDRISQLPNDILVYILSFLTVKEAVDTSVLSRHWLSLWRYIRVLDFDATVPFEEIHKNPKLRKKYRKNYVRWVNNTLEMCRVGRLEQFRVRFTLDNSAQYDIDRWLEFAIERNVQRLELNLLAWSIGTGRPERCYTFPAQRISHGDYTSQHRWHNFKSLTVLIFKGVNVTGEVLEFFLQNCQFLEEMVVHFSYTLVNLQVVGPYLKLKRLEICFCFNVESLKICDTNLVSFRTSNGSKLLLKNVPELTEVHISSVPSSFGLDAAFPMVSCVLTQLEFLELHFYRGLHKLQLYEFPELTKLKKFVSLVGSWEDASFLGLTDVMRAAPHLKELELQLMSFTPFSRPKIKFNEVVGCRHYHLEVVKVSGYHGYGGVIELLRYFINDAIALKKIIIDPRITLLHLHDPLKTFDEIKEKEIVRNLAKLDLEGDVPPHVELVIL